jgi:hypothetical protein
MSQWIKAVKAHPIHKNLVALTGTLSKVQDSIGARVEHLEILVRIKEIHQLLVEKIENLNPNLIVLDTLDAINSDIGNQNGHLGAYLNNGGDVSNLNQANTYTNSILLRIPNLPSPTTPTDIAGLGNTAASFREDVGRYLREIEEEFTALKRYREQLAGILQALTAEIGAQKGRLDAAIAEFQSQFSQSESTRRDQFTQAEAARLKQFTDSRAALDAAFAAIQKQSTEIAESRMLKFTEEMGEFRTSFSKFLKEADENRQVFEKQSNASVESYIDQIKNQKMRAEDIVSVISNTGMVGGYQRVADEERKQASKWEWITLGSMVGLIAFAIWAFWATTHTAFNWGLFSSRIFAALTFGILAAYSARQADKHHDLERRNRRVELELASIDPYILPLPEAVRHEVKRQLAERLFGQSESIQSGKAADTSGTALDVGKVVYEAVKAALDQVSKK